MERYLAGRTEWRDPRVEPAPLATKIFLMTPGGVMVVGYWDPRWCVAWAPLLVKPDWLRERLSEWGCDE
jgi:hypothetical protein